MAFLIKLGTMTIVVPTAAEAVDTFDKFVRDDKFSVPAISTFDGVSIAINDLRGIVNSERSTSNSGRVSGLFS